MFTEYEVCEVRVLIVRVRLRLEVHGGMPLHQDELFLRLVSKAITRASSSDDHKGRA